MSRRVIVNDEYRYLRIRAAIARDQLEGCRERWRSQDVFSRWWDLEVMVHWEREVFYHQRLLDMSISFSKFLPSGFAMVFDEDTLHDLYIGAGDETSAK